MTDPETFRDGERPAPSRTITDSDIRGWEERYGVTLPRTLAAVLAVRNGGGVSRAEFFIKPLAGISPLSDELLDEVSEGDGLDLPDGGELFVFAGDDVGAALALDYGVGPEPRVLTLWFDGAGESRAAVDYSDEFLGDGGEGPADV